MPTATRSSTRLKLRSYGKTDRGRVREKNEDYFLIYEPKDDTKRELYGSIYIVADGVGGHAKGEVASRLTAKIVKDTYYSLPPDMHPKERLKRSIERANDYIYRQGSGMGEYRMATTLVVAVVIRDRAYIANVGDSRAYIIRQGSIKQITQDHSLVEEQVRRGIITREEAKRSRYKNIITRGIGLDHYVNPDFFTVKLQKGDRLLLCTDGLTKVVSDREIYKTVISSSPQTSVETLISLANKRGGPDNITVIVVEIGKGGGGMNKLLFILPVVLAIVIFGLFMYSNILFGGMIKIKNNTNMDINISISKNKKYSIRSGKYKSFFIKDFIFNKDNAEVEFQINNGDIREVEIPYKLFKKHAILNIESREIEFTNDTDKDKVKKDKKIIINKSEKNVDKEITKKNNSLFIKFLGMDIKEDHELMKLIAYYITTEKEIDLDLPDIYGFKYKEKKYKPYKSFCKTEEIKINDKKYDDENTYEFKENKLTITIPYDSYYMNANLANVLKDKKEKFELYCNDVNPNSKIDERDENNNKNYTIKNLDKDIIIEIYKKRNYPCDFIIIKYVEDFINLKINLKEKGGKANE